MSLGIRTALAADLDALQALQWRSLRRCHAAPMAAALEAALWRLGGLGPRHVEAGTCLLCEADGEPVGFAAWQHEPLHRSGLPRERLPPLPEAGGLSATLRALHVAPEAEGQGFGRALLRAAERRIALRAGMSEALVPPAAEGFFRRHGYVAVSAHAMRLGPGAMLELRRMVHALPEAEAPLPRPHAAAAARAAARNGR